MSAMATKTDVLARFRAMGFVPPSERPSKPVLSAEARLRALLLDLDRLAVASTDGRTVTFDSLAYEAALARADGCN